MEMSRTASPALKYQKEDEGSGVFSCARSRCVLGKWCFSSTLRCQCAENMEVRWLWKQLQRGANKGISADAAGNQVVWATTAAATGTAHLVARPRLPMSLAACVAKEGERGRAEQRTINIHLTQM